METVTRPIFFLSDFGTRDSYVGQVKAVITGIAPGVTVIDLSHEVEPFAVDEGAWLLESALPVLPENSVILGVVDPGVGTPRRALAIVREGRVFVGPDNGLLSGALPEAVRGGLPPAGGAVDVAGVDAHEITVARFRRRTVSATFHGRDVFGPAAAHLALGADYRQLGPPVRTVIALPPFSATPGEFGCLEGFIVHIDRYGNLVTTIRAAQLFPSFSLEVGGLVIDTRVRTFADAPPGVPFCHVDSSGFVAMAINQGDAAKELGVRRGDVVRVLCE